MATSNAWTKAKVAIVAGAVVLAAAVATAAIIILCNQATSLHDIPLDWSIFGGDKDQWGWIGGRIVGHSTDGQSILVSSRKYRNVTLSAVVGTTNREASLALRMKDAHNGYIVIFAPGGTGRNDAGHISLVKEEDGKEKTLGHYHGRVFASMGQSAKVTAIGSGPRIEVRLNDVTVLREKDTTFESGFIGLRIYGDRQAPCDSTFSNVTFY